ncbi:allene oxide cyclase-like protein [Bufonid herpesvirus 1]|uniref:allene oxide cyclase-like protein n=1 Tax=Bufonid herpesvirus 1 TaxID=2282206 RepID=UPI000EB74B00|nr:allene oxide cyclase-like protein [Bufonid herpesvirus 1]AXF48514.1 allene oxide cyclase-like protein [Bufonid herpesvirus 1]
MFLCFIQLFVLLLTAFDRHEFKSILLDYDVVPHNYKKPEDILPPVALTHSPLPVVLCSSISTLPVSFRALFQQWNLVLGQGYPQFVGPPPAYEESNIRHRSSPPAYYNSSCSEPEYVECNPIANNSSRSPSSTRLATTAEYCRRTLVFPDPESAHAQTTSSSSNNPNEMTETEPTAELVQHVQDHLPPPNRPPPPIPVERAEGAGGLQQSSLTVEPLPVPLPVPAPVPVSEPVMLSLQEQEPQSRQCGSYGVYDNLNPFIVVDGSAGVDLLLVDPRVYLQILPSNEQSQPPARTQRCLVRQRNIDVSVTSGPEDPDLTCYSSSLSTSEEESRDREGPCSTSLLSSLVISD